MKKRIMLPILLVLALVLTSCTRDKDETKPDIGTPPLEDDGSSTSEQEPEKDTSTAQPDTSDDMTVGYEDIKLSPMDAFDIYVEKYPNTKVKKVELDTDYSSFVYKVEGYDSDKEYEIKINPVNSDILKDEIDNDDDNDDEEILRKHLDKVESIVNQALEEAGPGVKLEEWTLKVKKGKARLEVEIEGDHIDDFEHTYDAETGELLEKDD